MRCTLYGHVHCTDLENISTYCTSRLFAKNLIHNFLSYSINQPKWYLLLHSSSLLIYLFNIAKKFMILLLQHRRSAIVKKAKRSKSQKEPPEQSIPVTRDGLSYYKSYSDMVHGLRSQNEGKPNRPKKSSCHLKMVGKVIHSRALSKPPPNGVFFTLSICNF